MLTKPLSDQAVGAFLTQLRLATEAEIKKKNKQRHRKLSRSLPAEQRIEFESLIDIRPRLGNRSIIIQNEDVRQQVAAITRELLGGVQ